MKSLFYLSPVCFVIMAFCACSHFADKSEVKDISQLPPETERSGDYAEARQLATLEDKKIDESSGIVASRANRGIFWTHNDSGNPPLIYAIDAAGKTRGVWRVTGAENVDWEDIAIAYDTGARKTFLYIGDIGDNDRERKSIVVYRVAEPTVGDESAKSKTSAPLATERAEALRLQYPDGSHNAEALMIHPATGALYIVTKTTDGAAGVYKLASPTASAINQLVKIADVKLSSIFQGIVTGGDISPDGKRVMLCDYFAGFEFVSNSANFDDIWQTKPQAVNLGQRQQGEAVAYGADGQAVYATSEKLPTPLIEARRIK